MLRSLLPTLLSVACHVQSRIITSVAERQLNTYDFIIIGAGTAGSVLANRLSANPGTSVLVVEAGVSNEGILDITVPFLGTGAPGTLVDWNYSTTAQTGLDGRSIPVTRGFVLGGSSSINLMTWNRGSNATWDSLADFSGDIGWAWNAVEKYYKKSATFVPPADGRNTTGELEPTILGDGPVEFSAAGFLNDIDPRVEAAARELGGRFSFTLDLNSGDSLGVGFMPSSIGGGERSSAATAYLTPILDRDNLDILISTRVSKLLSSVNVSPRVIGVEVLQTPNGPSTNIYAHNEVIMCSGVIGTPQILQLSGIGPRGLLNSLGIVPIVENDAVGTNLVDHPMLANYFLVNSTSTFDDVLRNTTIFNDDLDIWVSSMEGLFVDSPANTQAFFKLPPSSGLGDPSSGPGSANTEMLFVNGFAPFGTTAQPDTGYFMTILTAVVSPISRGTVLINSTSPFTHPAIDLGIYTDTFDISAMVQVMNDAQEFLSASPWKGYIVSPFGDLLNATTDALKADFARNNSVTVNHSMGTARMRRGSGTAGGVVNSHLLVEGVDGLRIVDASVFPHVLEFHPQAAVYILAERAADLIKESYDLS